MNRQNRKLMSRRAGTDVKTPESQCWLCHYLGERIIGARRKDFKDPTGEQVDLSPRPAVQGLKFYDGTFAPLCDWCSQFAGQWLMAMQEQHSTKRQLQSRILLPDGKTPVGGIILPR